MRVRVWNDPFDANGNGYGGGDVDVDRAIEISQRATDAGLGVLVDFHYSDFWADPAKQQVPKAWEGMTADQVAAEVGTFTRDAVRRLVDAGVDLRMVQVGNETNGGVAGVRGWDDMAKVFSAGSAAVRAEAPDTLVAVHFTNPERAGFYADVAAQLDRRDVDYDVFASSYYPFWHPREPHGGALARRRDVRQEGHGRRDLVGVHARRRRRPRQCGRPAVRGDAVSGCLLYTSPSPRDRG